MLKISFKYFLIATLFNIFYFSVAKSEIVKSIEINGNERIPDETINMFSNVKKNQDLNENEINQILLDLYQTNFFKDVEIMFNNNILSINVIENPLIENVNYNGIKADKTRESIKKNLKLKSRSSFNKFLLQKDVNNILLSLKELGYYFASVDHYIENLDNNKINLTYQIDIGKKAKIKKISFIGNKVFKNSKLTSVIISEEYKFWKIISGKKYLNENVISLDKRLLKNFYLNEGYYDVEINSSFAKLINENEFELIFNIDAKNKIYFNKLDLILPEDYEKENFNDLFKLFNKMEGEPYSLNFVNEILEEIDLVVLNEQYEAINAFVNEEIISDQLNLTFTIEETEKFLVEKINIYGNNITRENVIRNNLEIDEGDIFNILLSKKSENNIKSLNLFKNVDFREIDGTKDNTKIIEISVEEKATGEIMAGAGFGTDGGTISFGVKENNYLGKGLKLNTDFTINKQSLKGQVGFTDPNYKNSDKSVYFNLQTTEIDRLSDFGYKTNKNGFSLGTDFEYYRDLNLGLGTSTYYEEIEADSTASSRRKKSAGDYWDTFFKMNFDYDKRNQKFKPTKGFRSYYNIDLPLISDTNTLTNTYDYKYYTQLFEDNTTSASILFQSSNSLSGEDIKLSERLYIPSRRLRGFEGGKIGPKDGEDFVGGNYITSLNLNTTIPQLFPNSQNFDFVMFVDMASIWGVDYDTSLDNNDIRSSIGVGVDWLTVVGPLSFSLAQPITKSSGDITETFRFNLGTTF